MFVVLIRIYSMKYKPIAHEASSAGRNAWLQLVCKEDLLAQVVAQIRCQAIGMDVNSMCMHYIGLNIRSWCALCLIAAWNRPRVMRMTYLFKSIWPWRAYCSYHVIHAVYVHDKNDHSKANIRSITA